MTTKAEIIAAIRADDTVGKGSLSAVDEAMTDEELWDSLVEASATGSVEQGLAHAKQLHELWEGQREEVQGWIF